MLLSRSDSASFVGFLAVIVCIVFYSSSSSAGNCSKREMLDLVKAGYSKGEIEEICSGVISELECCCAEALGENDSVLTHGRYNYLLEDGNIYFIWKDADSCGYRKNAMCVSSENCGR